MQAVWVDDFLFRALFISGGLKLLSDVETADIDSDENQYHELLTYILQRVTHKNEHAVSYAEQLHDKDNNDCCSKSRSKTAFHSQLLVTQIRVVNIYAEECATTEPSDIRRYDNKAHEAKENSEETVSCVVNKAPRNEKPECS